MLICHTIKIVEQLHKPCPCVGLGAIICPSFTSGHVCIKTARRSLWMFFLQRLRSCARQLFLCHLEADSPVLAPRALVMVTLMQPRDLEMKQTLFIALFQPDPQCKLPDYRSFMAVLCYCRSRTFLLQTFQNTEIQHLQCINVYKEIVNCPTR